MPLLWFYIVVGVLGGFVIGAGIMIAIGWYYFEYEIKELLNRKF